MGVGAMGQENTSTPDFPIYKVPPSTKNFNHAKEKKAYTSRAALIILYSHQLGPWDLNLPVSSCVIWVCHAIWEYRTNITVFIVTTGDTRLGLALLADHRQCACIRLPHGSAIASGAWHIRVLPVYLRPNSHLLLNVLDHILLSNWFQYLSISTDTLVKYYSSKSICDSNYYLSETK